MIGLSDKKSAILCGGRTLIIVTPSPSGDESDFTQIPLLTKSISKIVGRGCNDMVYNEEFNLVFVTCTPVTEGEKNEFYAVTVNLNKTPYVKSHSKISQDASQNVGTTPFKMVSYNTSAQDKKQPCLMVANNKLTDFKAFNIVFTIKEDGKVSYEFKYLTKETPDFVNPPSYNIYDIQTTNGNVYFLGSKTRSSQNDPELTFYTFNHCQNVEYKGQFKCNTDNILFDDPYTVDEQKPVFDFQGKFEDVGTIDVGIATNKRFVYITAFQAGDQPKTKFDIKNKFGDVKNVQYIRIEGDIMYVLASKKQKEEGKFDMEIIQIELNTFSSMYTTITQLTTKTDPATWSFNITSDPYDVSDVNFKHLQGYLYVENAINRPQL